MSNKEGLNRSGGAVAGVRIPVKRDPLASILAASPEMTSIAESLYHSGSSRLSFAPVGSEQAIATMTSEISRSVRELVREGRLKGIGIQSRYDGSLDSRQSHLQLEVKKMSKFHTAAKKISPNSLSRVITAIGPSSIEGEAYSVFAVFVTLILELEGEQSRPALPNVRLGAEPLGPRPALPAERCDNPDEQAASEMVERFMQAHKLLRADASQLAKELRMMPFKEHAPARRLVTLQMDVLLPLSKAFFGAGAGETILRMASAVPLAQARNARKVEGSMSREYVQHMMWIDALKNGRQAPPFINL